MFERFTRDARRAVVLAQEEARYLNHGYIGIEHLLLGLLHPDGDFFREKLIEQIGKGEQTQSGHIPFTSDAKTVLQLSLREALKREHRDITPDHILLAALSVDSWGTQTLTESGEIDALREMAEAKLDQLPATVDEATPAPTPTELVHKIFGLLMELKLAVEEE